MVKVYSLFISIVFIAACAVKKEAVIQEVEVVETAETPPTKPGEVPREMAPDCFDVRKKNPLKECETNVDYVCGCDGKTYLNVCEAEKAGLNKMKKGKCTKSASM
jgi:hypothetical protein